MLENPYSKHYYSNLDGGQTERERMQNGFRYNTRVRKLPSKMDAYILSCSSDSEESVYKDDLMEFSNNLNSNQSQSSVNCTPIPIHRSKNEGELTPSKKLYLTRNCEDQVSKKRKGYEQTDLENKDLENGRRVYAGTNYSQTPKVEKYLKKEVYRGSREFLQPVKNDYEVSTPDVTKRQVKGFKQTYSDNNVDSTLTSYVDSLFGVEPYKYVHEHQPLKLFWLLDSEISGLMRVPSLSVLSNEFSNSEKLYMVFTDHSIDIIQDVTDLRMITPREGYTPFVVIYSYNLRSMYFKVVKRTLTDISMVSFNKSCTDFNDCLTFDSSASARSFSSDEEDPSYVFYRSYLFGKDESTDPNRVRVFVHPSGKTSFDMRYLSVNSNNSNRGDNSGRSNLSFLNGFKTKEESLNGLTQNLDGKDGNTTNNLKNKDRNGFDKDHLETEEDLLKQDLSKDQDTQNKEKSKEKDLLKSDHLRNEGDQDKENKEQDDYESEDYETSSSESPFSYACQNNDDMDLPDELFDECTLLLGVDSSGNNTRYPDSVANYRSESVIKKNFSVYLGHNDTEPLSKEVLYNMVKVRDQGNVVYRSGELEFCEGQIFKIVFPTIYVRHFEHDYVTLYSDKTLKFCFNFIKSLLPEDSFNLNINKLAQFCPNIFWNLALTGDIETAIIELDPEVLKSLYKRKRTTHSEQDTFTTNKSKNTSKSLSYLDNNFIIMQNLFKRDADEKIKKLVEVERQNSLGPRVNRVVISKDYEDDDVLRSLIDENGFTKKSMRTLTEKQKNMVYRECMKRNFYVPVHIRFSTQKGRGVFAAYNIQKEDFLMEYKGELITEKVAKFRNNKYNRSKSYKGSFIFFFKHNGTRYGIDATEEDISFGPARLVNHSRKNSNIVPKTMMSNNYPRLIFIAKRDIECGEELLVDYGERDPEVIRENPWLLE